MIFTVNENNIVIGLATDGDIRRGLLNGLTLDSLINECHNTKFKFSNEETSRENLIKQLDLQTHFIPVLDQEKKLVSIITKDDFPINDEQDIYIRARAPVRISFGGGGSDVSYYFKDEGGAVINTAISIYSHATMKVRHDSRIIIKSFDLKETLTANNLEEALIYSGKLGLFKALLHVVKPSYGFELDVHSDFPVASGLGGSATVCAAVLGCFNAKREDKWTQHELAEIAFQAERLYLGVSGGWQDQYASIFGGFNFIEFNAERNVVNPLKIQEQDLLELEECLVLCDTGTSHNSGNIHIEQKENMSDYNVRKMVKENVSLSYQIKNNILRGEFELFGRALDQTWQLKKKFSKSITNTYINNIYSGAIENGALGGKLLGAGGGGFFVFYVPPFKKHDLLEYFQSIGLEVKPFCFESDGLKIWTSRIN
jgi:D-glycero-alpha-D-manno-heptose-7-phosphate kinase